MIRKSKEQFVYTKEIASSYKNCKDFDLGYNFFVDNFVKIHGVPSGSLVDLCCGTGGIAQAFKTQFPNLDIVGYEQSSEMAELASSEYYTVINQSIVHVNQTFDNVVSNNAYHHFDNIDQFWLAVNQASHSNSKILISDVVRPASEFQAEQIVKEVLGNNSIFEEGFYLSLVAGYSEDELHDHAKDLNLIILDTMIKDFKMFFIHN